MSLLLVKYLHWDNNRVVHRKDDDEVIPVLNKLTAAFENDFLFGLSLVIFLLLFVTCTIAVTSAGPRALIFYVLSRGRLLNLASRLVLLLGIGRLRVVGLIIENDRGSRLKRLELALLLRGQLLADLLIIFIGLRGLVFV